MKQGKSTAAAFDLDDLERELRQASAPRKAPAADDPLAELARIVGDGRGGARSNGAFDDFLSAPPQPVSGAMPANLPLVQPLFPAGSPELRQADPGVGPGLAMEPAAARAPQKPFDPLEALLSQDLGLRSGLDEMPAAPHMAEPKSVPASAMDDLAALDEMLAEEEMAKAAAQTVEEADAVAAAASEQPAAPPAMEAPAQEPMALDDIAQTNAAVPADGGQTADAGKFDDMMAEFEAAIRDVPAVATPAARSASEEPAQAAELIEPPMSEIVLPQAEPTAAIPPAGPGMMAAGAAAAAGGLAGAAIAAQKLRPKRGLLLAGGAIAVAVIGLGGLTFFSGSGARAPSGAAPVIAAKPGVTKERPANPGGVEVPNQDKEILQTRPAQPQQAERIAPREEQPVDLTQAQRQASAQGSQPNGAAQPVRQIPGVAIVAPVSTTPPANAPAPAEVQPRPVASVPIVIAGQPSPAPALSAPPSAAPSVTMTAPPAAVAPAPAAPPAAAAPAPRAPQAAAAAPAPAAGANQPAQTSEPRRVRSVPIRPEAGEAAPNRAQAQPRVVAAAPRPADAEAGTGPLRITPEASRAPAAPAPRPAAADPAPTSAGVVPSSVSSLEPQQTQSAAPPLRTASATAGSGFSVQLAAEGSEEAARAKFGRMRSQYGSVLGDSSPSIRSAEVNGRSVYRVRVGDMSREEAARMCERLKASGGSCFVARN